MFSIGMLLIGTCPDVLYRQVASTIATTEGALNHELF
jgi:hypothetical protein